MIRTTVSASREYEVITGAGLINECGKIMRDVAKDAIKLLIVSETNVAPLYLDKVKASAKAEGFEVYEYVFEAGEVSKNINTVAGMWAVMAKAGFTRTDLVAALGGGVTGDMAGFAAASFLRGIAVVQIPTSLLAMVDAAVGGKTGIDLPEGKNQVGAFWQPSAVIEDTDCLLTLSDEKFIEGMGEVLKYAFIMDVPLYEYLHENASRGVAIREDAWLMEKIVGMCVSDKADVVAGDELDNGRRQTLNYGHTVGHVIERDSEFTKLHGVCVAKGMGIMIDACEAAGTLASDEAQKMRELITSYGLPVEDDITPEDAVAGAMNDKKKRGNTLSVILVNKIGTSEIRKMSADEFRSFLEEGKKIR
ncbi:MAG: 3-dehydroquinate synthase [Saccharofermentans sp.]|nr:3-dehydroquinate synthase [Saccharofermentans sp.]